MSKVNKEEEIDYLEVDKPIPGQNYVCMSFVSPEKILQDKNDYFIKQFLNSLNKRFSVDNLESEYDTFINNNRDMLQNKFDEQNGSKTSIRGLKIRGTYDTKREAEVRAKVLQRLDKSFHVYVGQVGYWLPWDPNPDNIEKQEYGEKELNNLVKSYKDNESERDIYYQEQLNKRKEEIRKENEERKKENETQENSEGENPELQSKQDEILNKIMNTEDHSVLKEQFENYSSKENNEEVKEI
jgi:hypothetical protein